MLPVTEVLTLLWRVTHQCVVEEHHRPCGTEETFQEFVYKIYLKMLLILVYRVTDKRL